MKLIMFDMDGTLFRTETSFFPSVQEFARRHAFPAPDEKFLRSFIGQSGSEWRAWLEQLALGNSAEELAAEFDLLEQEYVKTQGELYAGTTDVLRFLALDGWKLGICSNAPAWYPEAILVRAGVHDLFTVIRVPIHPHHTKAMMLCEVWNELHPERCVMVGDRADDMYAAHAGGYFAIGAAYGWAPEELDSADVRIHDIAEVPMVLARHWSREAATDATVPVIPEAPVSQPSTVQSPVIALEDQEPAHVEPIVVAPQSEETLPRMIQTPPETILIPAAEPSIVIQSVVSTSPERVEEPAVEKPAVTAPVEPSVTPPAPAKPTTATPRPTGPEPAVITRRPWNPFRRRDDKSR